MGCKSSKEIKNPGELDRDPKKSNASNPKSGEIENNSKANLDSKPAGVKPLNAQNLGKNVLIVYAHPEPKSFVSAMRDTVMRVLKENGFEVKLSDLYAMNWNPIAGPEDFTGPKKETFNLIDEQLKAKESGNISPDLKAEHDKIKWANYIIFVFPFWWGSMPAIMKGWIDRCFFFGTHYDETNNFDSGFLKGKKAMIICSTSLPETAYRPEGVHKIPVDDRLHGITWGSLKFLGFTVLTPFYTYGIVGADEPTRKQSLIDLEKHLKNLKNLPEASFSNTK